MISVRLSVQEFRNVKSMILWKKKKASRYLRPAYLPLGSFIYFSWDRKGMKILGIIWSVFFWPLQPAVEQRINLRLQLQAVSLSVFELL